MDKKSTPKHGQYNLDFLNSYNHIMSWIFRLNLIQIYVLFVERTVEEAELHQRGKMKKHEADQEKDKIKKTIAYMEAVCYFCLCAISQHRLKKTAPNPTNKSAIELLNDTYQLLK